MNRTASSFLPVLAAAFLAACGPPPAGVQGPTSEVQSPSSGATSGPSTVNRPSGEAPAGAKTDQPSSVILQPDDFVELVALDPSFVIDIRYATENNFMKRKVYPVAKAYLRREAAGALVRVQARLRPRGLGLKIYDAYRPLSVQKILWSVMPDDRYVADPKKGSKHNRGAAVDLTLVDGKTGAEMEMPTGYDNFTERAWENDPECTPAARKNRTTLQEAMRAEGFETIDNEWWHFDYRTWKKFGISDHPIQ